MKRTKRMLALLLATIMVVGLLPLSASAVPNGATINVEVGESFEDFAGSIPQHVVSCVYCGRDLYVTTPDASSDYRNPSVTSSNPGIVTDLGYGFKDRTLSGDPGHIYDSITLKFTAAQPGTTTITVRYQLNFQVPSLAGYCNYCGSYNTYRGDYSTYNFTRTFTVNVTGASETDYVLEYNTNGGQTRGWTDLQTLSASSATFTVVNTVPVRDGYTFKGWADTADATVAGYLAGDPITVYQDNPMKTIYAVWEEVACEHSNIDWTDNGNGTHKGTCHDCGTVVTPSEAHTLTYTVNDDGTHTVTCTKCGFTETEAHTYDENHHCVCGAEDAFFTVFYSSENIANKVYMSECEGGYSFTDKVHDGYLYGGVYADNTYMETSAYKFDNGENGIHFTPKAGETYYVREINEKYFKMKLVASYKGNDVLNIYLMAGLDATYMDAAKNVQGFMAIGFLENAGDNTNVEGIDFSGYNKKNASAYYNSITINVGGQKFKFAPNAAEGLGFGLDAADKLYYYALGKDYVNANRGGGTRNVLPYYETCDGVIVTGAEMCTFSIVPDETNVHGFVRTPVVSRVYSAN